MTVSARKPEEFRTLYCDPGEDFGWCIGKDLRLLARGTTKMWDMADDVHALLEDPDDPENELNNPSNVRDEVDPTDNCGPVERIVCEDFRIYPWVAHSGQLDWDPVRTARVIGSLFHLARWYDIPIIFQPAAIKPAAVAAGAEELYDRPVHANRHQNDAIQHFVYFTNTELLGLSMPVPDNFKEGE